MPNLSKAKKSCSTHNRYDASKSSTWLSCRWYDARQLRSHGFFQLRYQPDGRKLILPYGSGASGQEQLPLLSATRSFGMKVVECDFIRCAPGP